MSSYIKPIITNNLLTLDGSSNQLFTSLTLEIFDANANSVFTSNSNINSADWTFGSGLFTPPGWLEGTGISGAPTWSLDVSALSLTDGNYDVVLTTNNLSFPFSSDVHNPPGFELIIDTVAPVVSIDTSVGVVADGYINRSETNNPLVLTGVATGVDDGQMVTVTLTDANNNSVSALGSVVSGAWTAGNFYTETTVNTTTVFDRGNPQITSLTDGGYVVSWLSYGSGVLAQRYDAAGDKVGSEISVNSPSNPLFAPNIWALDITGLTDGGYVVTWQSDIDDGNGTDIYAQRYDAANNAVGSETLINSTTADNQYAPSVAGLNDGGYIVSWNTDQFSSTSDIYAQRFDAAGNTVGSETLINSTTADNQYNSNIAGLADGGYIVSWTSGNQDGDIIGIYAQRYDAAGNTVGNETHINTTIADYQYDSSITGLADGGYVVSWESNNQDGDGAGIYAQVYDVLGNMVGGETLINTTTTAAQIAPSITALSDGGYVISWVQGVQEGYRDGVAIYTQRYDASNNAVGGETLINTSTNAFQSDPSITGLADGGYVVSWQADVITAGSYIYSQRFAADGSRESPTGIDFSNLDDGPLTIDVSVTDTAGNVGTAQDTTVILDTTAPTITIDTSTGTGADGFVNGVESGEPLVLSGTTTGVADGQMVEVTVTDVNSNAATAQAVVNGGTWALEHYAYTETLINTTTSHYQGASAITALSDGGFVVTWTNDNQDDDTFDVIAQRYDATGSPVGSEALINTTRDFVQGTSVITSLSDGGFVVTWESGHLDGYDIYSQRYDASSNPVGSETLINTTTASNQWHPAITALNDGGFVVAWESYGIAGASTLHSLNIYTQRYDAAGNPVDGETLINSTTTSDQKSPTITTLNDGGYVVAWASQYQDGNFYGIYAQRYDSDSNPVGSETLINTTTASNQSYPSITNLNDGGFVVTWISWNQDGSSGGIYSQRYDSDSNPVGSETLINSTTVGDQTYPCITSLNDGGFVVAWQSDDQDGSRFGIYVQRYNAAGNPVGDETLINTTTLNDQQNPAITALSDGGFVVTWQSDEQDGDDWGIYAQRFAADGSTVGGVDVSNLDDGALTIDVSVADTAGNIGTAQDSTVVLDTTPAAIPTVNTIDTGNTRPWLSGAFDADDTETLTVTVDGKTYSLAEDSNLFQHANNANIWVLKPAGFYHLGEHDVVVQVVDTSGNITTDQTTGELTISRDMFAPRVNLPKQIYNKRPAVGGSFDEAATETLTVEVDGTVYTLGVDAELSNHLNNKWVLNLSTLETPLSDGVYDVIVNTTDANSVTKQDASTGELTIGMVAPTVYELESTNFKPVLRGFYDADFGDGLTVTVNGDSYTLGVDSELTTHVSNDYVWVLRPSNALNFGDNDIELVATDTKGKDKTDITSDEIHIYQSKSQAVHGDVLITQAGDDIITINDNTFTQIDAGLGVDTLLLDGDVISLNFANIQGIDVVDMSGSASTANTLTLTLDDVLSKTDSSSLSVLGDSADTITLATADNWTANGSQVIDGVTYNEYDSGSASLLIEQSINIEMG